VEQVPAITAIIMHPVEAAGWPFGASLQICAVQASSDHDFQRANVLSISLTSAVLANHRADWLFCREVGSKGMQGRWLRMPYQVDANLSRLFLFVASVHVDSSQSSDNSTVCWTSSPHHHSCHWSGLLSNSVHSRTAFPAHVVNGTSTAM
jgi:hypothetical protein